MPDENTFPEEEWRKLFFSAKARLDEHGKPGNEYCDLVNKMLALHRTGDPTLGLTFSLAMAVIPGMEDQFNRFLHTFGHLCFEIGRQYEQSVVDFSGLTADDLKG